MTGGAGVTEALEVTVSAPVASFRNPLYAAAQLCLPCPPPATVGGLLAAAAGGWDMISSRTRFAMAFSSAGAGVDLETYHPLDGRRGPSSPVPRDREYLVGAELTVWLLDDLAGWRHRLRRPVWPLRLGRSQDLAAVRVRPVRLLSGGGDQAQAVVPAGASPHGRLQQLPTAISRDRSRIRWDAYRYQPSGRGVGTLTGGWATEDGRAVVLLPPTHPVHAERQGVG